MRQRLGKYQIRERIGRGGQAEVYRAFDADLQQDVALKIFHGTASAEQPYVEQLRRESDLSRNLVHNNIVTTYDFLVEDDVAFMVMEYLPGSLAVQIRDSGRLPVDRALEIGIQIASALAYAHGQNVVHRDVKPQNVILTMDGVPKLCDFGIARAASYSSTATSGIGSGPYMGPEQWRGSADTRSDIYGFGVLLYELLSGQTPFRGPDQVSYMRQHLENAVPPLDAALNIPDALESIIRKCMEKAVEDRYQTMGDVIRDLAALQEPELPPSIPEDDPDSIASMTSIEDPQDSEDEDLLSDIVEIPDAPEEEDEEEQARVQTERTEVAPQASAEQPKPVEPPLKSPTAAEIDPVRPRPLSGGGSGDGRARPPFWPNGPGGGHRSISGWIVAAIVVIGIIAFLWVIGSEDQSDNTITPTVREVVRVTATPTQSPTSVPTRYPTPSPTARSASVTELFKRAWELHDAGDYEKAIEDYTKVIELDPSHADAYNNLGVTHAKLGNNALAIENYTSAIEIDPMRALYFNNRGLMHDWLGDTRLAELDFETARQLDPELPNLPTPSPTPTAITSYGTDETATAVAQENATIATIAAAGTWVPTSTPPTVIPTIVVVTPVVRIISTTPTPTTGEVFFDQTVSGFMPTGNVVHGSLYFYGEPGASVSIEVIATSGDLDPFVSVRPPAGSDYVDDNSGNGKDALIEDIKLDSSGKYHITISAYPETSGGYILRVSKTTSPPVGEVAGATATVSPTALPTPEATVILPDLSLSTPTAAAEFTYSENFNNSSSGTKKLLDDQYYTISGNPQNITLNVRLRTQNSFGEAWVGWGNTGLEFTTQGANITKLKTDTGTTLLSANISPSDWHEYKLVRTSQQMRLYVDGQIAVTDLNSNSSTGPIRLGGVCPYSICTAYMELDWIEVSVSDDSDLIATATPSPTATRSPTLITQVTSPGVNGTFLRKIGSADLTNDNSATGNYQFGTVRGLAVDSLDNLYVVDNGHQRIMKYDSTGSFVTKWGAFGRCSLDRQPDGRYIVNCTNGHNGFIHGGDGEFKNPWGIAVDSSDNIYVADFNNYRIQVFDPQGNFLRKWTSVQPTTHQPQGIAIDSSDNVYVLHGSNELNHYGLSKYTSAGTFITGWGAWGTGTGEWRYPSAIAISPSDQIYVLERNAGSRVQIFDANGTYLSEWSAPDSGGGIAIDQSGNVYISENDYDKVHQYSASGTLLASWGEFSNCGNVPGIKVACTNAENGKFNTPEGLALDSNNNLYVGEENGRRVQLFH